MFNDRKLLLFYILHVVHILLHVVYILLHVVHILLHVVHFLLHVAYFLLHSLSSSLSWSVSSRRYRLLAVHHDKVVLPAVHHDEVVYFNTFQHFMIPLIILTKLQE